MRTNEISDTQEEIISYQKLRTFIGITGILLPVLTVLGCYLFGAGNYSWQHSISHYYYTRMHIVFTGTLCVLGGFLITYRGKSKKTGNPWESRVSNIAGLCAFGIASFRPALINSDRRLEAAYNIFFYVTRWIKFGGHTFCFCRHVVFLLYSFLLVFFSTTRWGLYR